MTAAEPGIDGRRAGVLAADAKIGPDVDWTAPRVHRALFDAHTDLSRHLTRAIADVLDDQTAPLATLDTLGVTALDGRFAELCVQAVNETDEDALWNLLRTARQLGSGQTSLDLRSDRDDLDRAAIPIFAASDVTPTIAIQLDGRFSERKPAQRRDVLDLCLALAEGCRVHLVVTGLAGRFLWEHHRDQLPTSVTDRFNPQPHSGPGQPPAVTERVTTARETLDPDGTVTTVLRTLRDEPSETLSYDALSRELRLSETNRRQVAHTLDHDLALAERIDVPGGGRGLSLRPAGQAYLEAIDEDIGSQHRLPPGASDSVTPPPKSSDNSRVSPRAWERREVNSTDHSAADRPADEANAVTATQDHSRDSVHPVYLDRPSYEGARMAAASGEIALVDAPVERLQRRDGDRDCRVPGWSYDEDAGDLVAAATYTNPMQYWTCIARALASTWTWNRVLTEDVLAEIFATHSRRILRDARNIGGLSEDRYEDPAAFIAYYQNLEATLCDLTQQWRRGEYDSAEGIRSEITQLAKGVSGSIAQLLDLADIGLVREVRLPAFSRNWSDAHRRQALVRTLAHSCSIESVYGHFVVHRQLYEQRDGHREAAMDPNVDAYDPLAELVGSIVVVGPGVSNLEDELRAALRSPGELHDNAPEIAVRIPVRTTASRSVIARTVRRMCERKQLTATREPVSLFDGFVATSYDVARAIHRGLTTDDHPREIRIDEVRRALAHLDPDRLLPTADVNPTMRKALSVLLGAEQPLSEVELARRADITTQSFRDNREGFVVIDLLRETPEGWRLSLSFADERYDEQDGLPWLFVDEPDGLPEFPSVDLRQPFDVLFELATSLVEDPQRFGDPDDVVCWAFMPPDATDPTVDSDAVVDHHRAALEAFCEEWPWLGGVFPLIEAACETLVLDPDSTADPVLMGPELSQQPLATCGS